MIKNSYKIESKFQSLMHHLLCFAVVLILIFSPVSNDLLQLAVEGSEKAFPLLILPLQACQHQRQERLLAQQRHAGEGGNFLNRDGISQSNEIKSDLNGSDVYNYCICISFTFSVSACPFPYVRRNPGAAPFPVLPLLPLAHGLELQWTAWLSAEPPATHLSALKSWRTQTQIVKHRIKGQWMVFQIFIHSLKLPPNE